MSPQSRPYRGRPGSLTAALAAVLLAGVLTGCQDLPSDRNPTPPPAPEYGGLAGRTFAVLVSADDPTLYQFPGAALAVCQAVSGKLAETNAAARPMHPGQLAEFQRLNPYWLSFPPSNLLKRLQVDRLVLVELSEYSTHEPGNAYVWQGVIVATLSVAESDAANPDNYVYRNVVHVRFPEKSGIGVANSDDPTIQRGMIEAFANDVAARLQPVLRR